MTDHNHNGSRVNKFEKRRKNTKSITVLLIVGGVLLIVLIGFWIFGGGDNESADTETENEEESSDFLITEDEEEQTEDETTEDTPEDSEENEISEDDTNTDEENENIEIESAEPSDDNVAEAYTGNWDPIGTEQEGPHTTNYEDGSQDRIEMKRAASIATGISEDDMVEWFYGNGGDQKVVATVSDQDETETYRVFLSWVDNEGWQPTKVEKLIENDKG